jgi:adenine/guanine phosphoribosyltransferase-like PRPP-binding protein
VLAFLEAHEPDLIACAEHLGVPPARLVAARERLER